MKNVRILIAATALAAALMCVLPGAWASAVPVRPVSILQLGRAIVRWPLGLVDDENATELALIADEVFARVDSILGVEPESIGSVQIMCEEATNASRAGTIGGSRAGMVISLSPEKWRGAGRWAGSRHLLALEYSRVVLGRISTGEYSPNVAFFDGIVNAAADLAYPGNADFPYRCPHLVCAGLLMLDYLRLPSRYEPWFYVFLTGESFCRFLAEEHGGRALVELDRALRRARDSNSAFMDVFGRSLGGLEEDWRSMLDATISEEHDQTRALMLGRAVRDLSTSVWSSWMDMNSLAEVISLDSPSLVRQSVQRFYDVCNSLYDLEACTLDRAQAEYDSALDRYAGSLKAWRDCAQELLMEVIWPVDSGAGTKGPVVESIDRVRRVALEIGAQDIIDLCEQYLQKASFLQP